MANMLYNGIELPDINEVWTEELKATYPYGYIYKNSGFAGGYGLNCSTYHVRINNGLIWTAGGSRYLQFGLNSAGEWEQRGTVTVNSDKGIFSSTAYPVIWAGFDIIDRNDSTVYLAASDPIPATMLYNGVELPNIESVWTDKETYPYALIYTATWTSPHSYCLSVFSVQPVGNYISGSYKNIQYLYKNGIWSYYSGGTFSDDSLGASYSFTVWTSFEWLDSSGTVHFAASDPVDPNAPTEPENPIIPFSFNRDDFIKGLCCGLASSSLLQLIVNSPDIIVGKKGSLYILDTQANLNDAVLEVK
jgi:hypothetical protein